MRIEDSCAACILEYGCPPNNCSTVSLRLRHILAANGMNFVIELGTQPRVNEQLFESNTQRTATHALSIKPLCRVWSQKAFVALRNFLRTQWVQLYAVDCSRRRHRSWVFIFNFFFLGNWNQQNQNPGGKNNTEISVISYLILSPELS
jgi:hypothetical protein